MNTRFWLAIVITSVGLAVSGQSFGSGFVNVVLINGIQNTVEDATEAKVRVQTILNASENHTGGSKRKFSVSAIYNPIGFTGRDGSPNSVNAKQDRMEIFLLKTAEERYIADLQLVSLPHNVSKVIDVAAAVRVKAFLDDLTPGGTSLDLIVTDEDMRPTKEAALSLVDRVRSLGSAIMIPHSQGNLLANLAYAALAAEFGQNLTKKIRVVNVANNSSVSVNSLDFTHDRDDALTALRNLPTLARAYYGEVWLRSTPICGNFICDFTTTMPPLTGGVRGDLLGHSFLKTYLSEFNNVQVSDARGVEFTANRNRFVDRFEDFVYAAVNSLEVAVAVKGGWVSFAQGNPGIPGDRVIVARSDKIESNGTAYFYKLATPIALTEAPNGLTISPFVPVGDRALVWIVLKISDTLPLDNPCHVSFGSSTGSLYGPIMVNGVPAPYVNVYEAGYPSWVSFANLIRKQISPSCPAIELSDLYLIAVWPETPQDATPFGFMADRLDALWIGFGIDALP